MMPCLDEQTSRYNCTFSARFAFRSQMSLTWSCRMTTRFSRSSCDLANGTRKAPSNWWDKFRWFKRSLEKLLYVFYIASISQAKRFYRFKQNNPRYCDKLLPSTERKVFSSGIVIPLPERNANGSRLMLVNCGKLWNTKVITIDEIFRSVMLSLTAALAEPKTQVYSI